MASILLIQSDLDTRAHVMQAVGIDPCLAVCGAVDSLARARLCIARRIPDLLIADLRLPDGRLVELLADLRPGRSHVLALTASLRDPQLLHALRQGADACLLLGGARDATLDLVRQVLGGESAMAPEIARRLLVPGALGPPAPWTDAERALLRAIGEGHATHELAREFEITPRQVGVRVRALYRKLHAASAALEPRPHRGKAPGAMPGRVREGARGAERVSPAEASCR